MNLVQRRATNVIYYSIAGLGAAYFTQIYFWVNEESPAAPLVKLLNGTASLPFQYRALAPWIARAAYAVTSRLIPTLDPEWLFKFVVLAFLFVLLFGFERYMRLLVKDETTSRFMSLSLFYVLPFNFLLSRYIPDLHPADIPSVALFTLGLLALYKRHLRIYYAIFAIATLNRETSCFLTIVYLLTAYGKDDLKTMTVHAAAQLMIWVAIKLILYWWYRGNTGGGVFEIHLADNLSALISPKRILTLLSNFGFIWLPTIMLYRHIHDEFIRKALWVSVPYVLGMFVVGLITEIRIFGELIPIFLPAFLLIVMAAFGGLRPTPANISEAIS